MSEHATGAVQASQEERQLSRASSQRPRIRAHRATIAWRIAWMVLTLMAVQGLVCGLSMFPVVVLWSWLLAWLPSGGWLRLLVMSGVVVPSYVLFSLVLMPVSACAGRLTKWQAPAGAEMRIADVDWVLLDWARGMVGTHVVRHFAGTLFRGTPIWTAYLRMAGARVGNRVYVNSLGLSDYNLLELGDGVVIGADTHLSGHTVEDGVVKTARVRLGQNVMIGLGAIIEIGVHIGDGAQVGAKSFVPKYANLDGGRVYAGVPARPLQRR